MSQDVLFQGKLMDSLIEVSGQNGGYTEPIDIIIKFTFVVGTSKKFAGHSGCAV